MLSHERLRVVLLWGVLMMGLWVCPPQAYAQSQAPQLTTQVQSSDNPDAQVIQDFAKYWFGQVLNGADAESIARGRRELVNVLTGRGTSQTVVEILSDALKPELPKALDNNQSMVRLNGLIIASVTLTTEIADLSVKALADEDWSVRYWGAKAYAEISQRQGRPPDQVVLDAMVNAAAGESSEAAYAQYVRTLGGFGQSGNWDAQIDILSKRADLYIRELNTGLATDRRLAEETLQALVRAKAEGQNIDQPLRDLVAATTRLVFVAVKGLQGDPVSPELLEAIKGLVEMTESVFDFAILEFGAQGNAGPSLTDPFNSNNYGEVLLNLYDWMGTRDEPGILTQSLNVPFDKIEIKMP